jgi:hypothetical protein
MRWADWFRVPAVAYRAFFQNAWPAALLLFAAYFFYREGHVRQRTHLCSIPLPGFAVLQAALAISWSEDYAPFAAVFSFMSYYGKELMVTAFALVVLFGFHLGRACGLALATFACVAILALYWPDTRIINVHFIYDSVSVRLDGDVTPFYRPAGFIVAAFSAASFVLIAVVQRRCISRVGALSFVFLALPLVHVLMVSSELWRFWQPLWMKLALISAALGVAGIAWAVLDRTNPDQCTPPPTFP